MSRLDRREFVAALAAVPVVASLLPGCARAQAPAFNTRPLKPAGEVPVVGIGTARLYQDPQSEADYAPLKATLVRFAELGGKVIDTAPSYGRAEEVLGKLTSELGIRDKLYLATKVGADSLDAGKGQIEQSFKNLKTDFIDLIAVHNLRDTANHLAYLRELRDAGRIGAVGVTSSFDGQYEQFAAVMEREQLDCIQIDYALDNRNAAQRILPLAQEKGIPPMINLPFGRGSLFQATQGKPLPDWAAEIGATTWAQVFLKYIISHPSKPIAIPGTDQVRYVDDNLGAARGPLTDAALRTKMEQFIDGL
ncbi:aldo/keto reductase [Altererythrobacter sp. Root672]|uniref:aldo/keto reductase n=1 Tax=Altererythrobacter sp. Root672 TaxID=1736584 RepID=UPI0006F79E60|nr:aldo/keto reductase [Altererythrobacter sp. Root672]KRA82610.1 aldo/keto reductase [Altererythrobacter sp. Root672]